MKRMIALCACAFLLSACGNQSGSSNDQSSNNQSGQSGVSATASTSGSKSSGQSGTEQPGGNAKSSPKQFASQDAKRSYALGMDIGNSLKNLPVKVDLDQLTQGVRDELSGGKTRLTEKAQHEVMQGIVADMDAAQKQKQQQKSTANLQAGKKFLAENKDKPGVKTLKDGLQYKVIKKGSGAQPDANDSVTVDYTGTLINGTVFDSSEKRGKPATFPVNAVIPGWTEALQLMHAGGEYKLFVPPDLAYGKHGAGSKIGPNETLVFDVKLLSVDKSASAGTSNAGSGSSDNKSTNDSTNSSKAATSDSSGSPSSSATTSDGKSAN